MNINDVTEEIAMPVKAGDAWREIFKKQMSLAEKYKDIENMGDLLDTLDNNINTAKGQKWIKDFAWRTTEELAEAYEALEGGHEDHFKEELIDALHFLTEMTIIAGYVNFKPTSFASTTKVGPWDVIYQLGLMCNTLKNKPWKQTQMLTDRNVFQKHLNLAWNNMYTLLRQEVGDYKEIFKYYFKKHKVNEFRQRSKY